MKPFSAKLFLYAFLSALLLSSVACSNLAKATEGNSASSGHETIANTNTPESALTDSPIQNKAPDVTSQSVAGIYHYKTYKPNKGGYDNTLEITDKGNGKLHISLEGSNAYLTAAGDETMHDASGEGNGELNGNTATARITPDGEDRPCRVNLNFTAANQVQVLVAKNCSFNVSLDGLYTKEKTSPANRNQSKSNADTSATLLKVSFSQLRDFINDFNKNKTGMHFVVTDIPAEQIAKVEAEGTDSLDRDRRGLYYFSSNNEDDSDASTTFIGSAALYKDYQAKVEYEPAKLRITAVIVESDGEFDMYRSPFATRIEGLDESGKVLWTINGSEPPKVKFRH